MLYSRSCTDCANDFPATAERCPHCGRPGLFPNVYAAEQSSERLALAKRYDSAFRDATSRAADRSLRNFETSLADSRAVIARSAPDLLRLATSDNEIYGTYYGLLNAGIRLPAGNKWDVLRGVVDSALFPNYKEHIRFAALSLDGVGLSNYGEYSIALRTDMMGHRATVFFENSILFMNHQGIKIAEAHSLPVGYRATWNDRSQLCVAKLSQKIDHNTRPDKYCQLLLRQGKTSAEDDFVEVHIWGPMTVRSIERVTVTEPKAVNRAMNKTIKAKLAKAKVEFI